MPAPAALAEQSREVSEPATLSETGNPSNSRESDMLEPNQNAAKRTGANHSDAVAGALLLGITMQVFAGPLGGVLGALAGAAVGTAVFPRLFPHHQNGTKRVHE
jgi:hypothetical protein